MTPDGELLRADGAGTRLACYVQPRASRNAVTGIHDHALKVALTAPPVDGAANAALTAFLAECFHLPKSGVRVASGLTGRRKTVYLALVPEAVQKAVTELAANGK